MKKMAMFIGIITVILLILTLLPFFLVYRKYHQYKVIKNRNKRLYDGINILEPVNIGGIKQWISVRGENTENPILLVLHGGPFFSMMPFSYIFESLESKFTIVQWDQRGSGKTNRANKHSSDPIMLNQMQTDAVELVNYLRHRFNKARVIVLGHSWGSVLGLNLAHDHPELIYAYIGTGQLINGMHNEQLGYDKTLEHAYAENNKEAIKELEKLVSFQKNAIDHSSMAEFKILRKWQFKFNPISISKLNWVSITTHFLSEPDYSLIDYFYLFRGVSFLMKSKDLFSKLMSINMEGKTDFSTDIYIFGGKKDPVTDSLLVYQYFQQIHAPYKEYIWFENSGHNLFFEETDKFIQCLCAVNKI